METAEKEVWTIGHSTRSQEEFIEILRSFKIEILADVRRFPGSNKFPHFNGDNLKTSLAQWKISYLHLEDLGGRRKGKKDSENTAWRVASFRAYADYMATDNFHQGMELLENKAQDSRLAFMCSEAVWWSCHRSLISDLLKIKGWKVSHIMNENKVMDHPYTKAASINGGKLSYKDGNT